MTTWSEYPLISIITVSVLTLLLLYLVRIQAHTIIKRAATLLHRLFRLTARACLRTEQRLRFRNHEVTKALVEALMERQLERRFLRIEKLVERDLANYQKLSAGIKQQLVLINEDYESTTEVPAASPEWVEAVDAIANLQNSESNSNVINKILADLHKTVQQHQREVMREYRWTVSARHRLLSGLRPRWHKLGKMLESIDNNIQGLTKRLHQVDQHMGQFELLTAGTRQGLMASMLMRFVIALCFVSAGVAAAWMNIHFLEQPFVHILSQAQLGGLPFASVAAAMHIAVTLMAATMITESLRITHLFPLMAAMTVRGRHILLATGGTLLLVMACIEAMALAGFPVLVDNAEINTVSRLVLVCVGFIMPIVLSLVLVPLEYLLCTVRPVLGSLLQLILHVCVLVLRLVGAAILELGKLITLIYDVVIFIPLACESFWRYKQNQQQPTVQQTAKTPSDTDDELDVANVTALRFGAAGRNDNVQ